MFIIDYNILYLKLDLCSTEYCGNVAISNRYMTISLYKIVICLTIYQIKELFKKSTFYCILYTYPYHYINDFKIQIYINKYILSILIF